MRTVLVATTLLAAIATGEAVGAPVGPDFEADLIKISETFAQQFRAAPDEMARETIRHARKKAICANRTAIEVTQRQATGWIGTVETSGSTKDGRGILNIQISPTVSVGTWNNSESDRDYHSLIPAETNMSEQAAKLVPGQKVRFSGTFYPSRDDCFREVSLTRAGSVTEPRFLFRFSSVEPIQ